jgi:hypothetical protein
MSQSIFEQYYSKPEFIDRYSSNSDEAIDVIIPVYHTNELWEANLLSIYKEVPVKRLLISDGGVIDNGLEVVKKFPRVEILDHREYKTLGKCIAELIKEVKTEWFIYLHSDVFLPTDWFDTMKKYQDEYDWYGCPMNITVMVNYRLDEPRRPYAGSQMGRKAAFATIDRIDDDFVYRQEDFVFNQIVSDNGFKNGKVEDTFHYHQVMYRKSTGLDLNVTAVNVQTKTNKQEILRTKDMQLRGVVKYLDPIEPWAISEFQVFSMDMLLEGLISYFSFKTWIKIHNDKWLKFFGFKVYVKYILKKALKNIKSLLN